MTDESGGGTKIRLNKVLARAGVASRRAADRLIEEGRVGVNGSTVTALGMMVDPEVDAIKVDGHRLPKAPVGFVYYVLNKPRACMTTLSDPEGRKTVADLIPGIRRRVFPVGRLDYQSEGLLLLTDDGDLSRALMHPSSGVMKTYQVKVRGIPSPEALSRIRRGVVIDGRKAVASRVRMLRQERHAWCEIGVHEGRKHLVRKLFEAVGHPVIKLRRTRYGGVSLDDLGSGEFRALEAGELDRLRRAAGKSGGRRN